MNKLAAIAVFLSLGLTVPAHATVWTFTGSGSSEASPLSFTSGGITITATGYNNSPFGSTNLSQNLNGLGIADTSGEITDTSFIVLNLTNIIGTPTLSLSVYGANTSNEYNVYESNSAPSGPPNGSGSGFTTLSANDASSTFVFTKSSTENYIAIEVPAGASTSSVELNSLTTVAPEPGYYGLLSLGLAGLGFAAFRRRPRLVADSTADPSTAV
jgi:hypothetical protein